MGSGAKQKIGKVYDYVHVMLWPGITEGDFDTTQV
jgi:hypothetical protein